MLCQFIFKNFKSYRDETIFDMQAAKIEEFADSLIPGPGENFSNLLPVAAIYGPNGGGKSNFIHALAYLISRIVLPIESSTGYVNRLTMLLTNYRPFLFDNLSKEKPAEFALSFRTNSKQYQYQLSVLGDDIVSESLYFIKTPCKHRVANCLFEREYDSITTGTAISKANSMKISKNIPYLSFLAINYSFPEIEEAVEWFESCCVINYSLAGSDHRFSSLMNAPEVKPMILSFFKNMDIPISGYDVVEETAEDGSKKTRIITKHTIDGQSYALDLKDESQGSIKMLSALPSVIISLTKGSPLIVDELDAKLHPQLLRYLIFLYTTPQQNPHHAQLIFNCHDISILKNYILRRDEIWFAARDEHGASELWSLYDIRDEKGDRIKNTAAYDKQYLSGRYGADPVLKTLLDWRDLNG